jgi:DNA-binding HxlR family transcriptional regulator
MSVLPVCFDIRSTTSGTVPIRIPKRKPTTEAARPAGAERAGGRPAPRPGRPARGTATGRPLLVAFDLLGRRWALRVLWELRGEPLGFRALQERCEGMSSSVLRDRLAELTGAAILETDDAGRYTLSEHGRRLLTAMKPLSRWAEEWGAAAGR